MRTSILALFAALMLFAAVIMFGVPVVEAQSRPTQSSQSEQTARRTAPTTSLLARSEMQTPKPIPIVRQLRFQEIPASSNGQGVRKQAGDLADSTTAPENPSQSNPAPGMMPVTNGNHSIQ